MKLLLGQLPVDLDMDEDEEPASTEALARLQHFGYHVALAFTRKDMQPHTSLAECNNAAGYDGTGFGASAGLSMLMS